MFYRINFETFLLFFNLAVAFFTYLFDFTTPSIVFLYIPTLKSLIFVFTWSTNTRYNCFSTSPFNFITVKLNKPSHKPHLHGRDIMLFVHHLCSTSIHICLIRRGERETARATKQQQLAIHTQWRTAWKYARHYSATTPIFDVQYFYAWMKIVLAETSAANRSHSAGRFVWWLRTVSVVFCSSGSIFCIQL